MKKPFDYETRLYERLGYDKDDTGPHLTVHGDFFIIYRGDDARDESNVIARGFSLQDAIVNAEILTKKKKRKKK